MHMLNRRVHLLFPDDLYARLAEEAELQHVSVGELVREAVAVKYGETTAEKERREVAESFEWLTTWRKEIGVSKDPIPYKEWIENGRKY
jgi:Ribbon-helix-helix protein, copG family